MKTLLIIILTAIFIPSVMAGNIYVPVDYPTIQEAIDASSTGDEIFVYSGIYSGEGNRDLFFNGKSISINGNGATIDCGGSASELHRAFNILASENVVIENFKIINGYTDLGGAIYCAGFSMASISLCQFSNNTSISRGGAVYCTEESKPKITQCVFNSNKSHAYGGALYFHFNAYGKVYNSRFENNSSIHGGAVICNFSSPQFTTCLFSNNTAEQYGGAVFIQDSCKSTFRNCTFVENSATTGSALYLEQRAGQPGPSNPRFEHCIIAYNFDDTSVISIYADPVFMCTNIYGNPEIGWPDSIVIQSTMNGNFSAEPHFEDTALNYFAVLESSPCAPDNNICGELVGAYLKTCCMEPSRGNANYSDDDAIDISDLVFTITWMFNSGNAPPCLEEMDVNASTNVDIGDLVLLVQYMFQDGKPPLPCYL